MRTIFKRRLLMQVIAILLAMALNMGALDSLLRFTVHEWALGNFDGFLNNAVAKNVEVEKNKNSLPESAGPKKHKNLVEEEARENREVKEKRTPKSKTYKIGENEFKTEVFQNPIHYINEKNELLEIDNTLVESSDNNFAFENKANNFKVRFSAKAGEKKLGKIQKKDSSIQWAFLDGKEVTGKTSQNNIIYSGIKENTDLRYIVDGPTLKEEIILNSSDASAEFKFVLNLKNLEFETREDGSINFMEPSTGNVVWVMPKPFMYDAKGERSESVMASLENKWGRLVLTVKADNEWISATNRQFPIVIDPTLQPGPSDGRDTFISSNNPSTNYRPNHNLYVGNTPAYGDTRSFFYFDNLTTEKDITITDAKFYAYATEGSLTSINLYPIQVNWDWDTTTMTWNFWRDHGKLGGLIDTANGANGWWNFNVTSLVQQWVDNQSANFGLALFPAGGSGYREFISCDHGDSDLRPKLVYTYSKGTVGGPANFKLHIDRKTGKIKADGTAVADARIYLNTDDGQSFTTTADSAGKWEKSGMPFEKGKTKTISMYYEYEIEVTDEAGNTSTITVRSDTTSQKFLIAIYSKGARTKKLAKFYYYDGIKATKLKKDNEIKTELEMVVGDHVLVLDPMRNMPYTTGPIIKDPDEKYRLREKIRPLNNNGEVVGDSIDAATGNFFVLEMDLFFDAQGLPIEFTRAINSNEQEMYRGPLGQNWHFGYDKMLIMYEDKSIEVTGGDGGGIFFHTSGSGYTSDIDVTEKLVKNNDGTYSVITQYRTTYHFNTDGMIDSITDRNGNTVSLTYDLEGLLSKVNDERGRLTELNYDQMGRITLIEDPEDRQLEYIYEPGGRLSQVVDPNGGATTYEYDPADSHRITKIIDPMDNDAITNIYDDQGRVKNQRDAEEYYVELTYNTNTTTLKDKNGIEFTYSFDNENRIANIKGPELEVGLPMEQSTNQVQTLRFGDGKRGSMSVDPEMTTAFVGNEIAANTSTASLGLPLVQYHYDYRGNPDQVTDAKGNVTYYRYDERNNIAAVLNEINGELMGTRFEYNDPNNRDLPTDIINALNYKTHITYDGKGNMLTLTNPENQTTVFTYYSSGQIWTVEDPAGKNITYTYDHDGNLDTIKDGRGNITYYDYDNISRLTAVEDPKGNHTYYKYDDNSNLIEDITPLGKTVKSYDYNGNLLGIKDAEENVTTYRYDKRGDAIQEIDPLLNTTLMDYDGNGNKLWNKYSDFTSTNYKYDVLGRLKKVIDPSGDTMEYFYDPNGNKVGEMDAKGQITGYEYDEFNRLIAVINPLKQREEYTYNELGNLLFRMDTGGAVTEYRYDSLSRVKEIIDPMNYSTKITYDLSGNQKTVTNQLNQTYTYYYDENNNLTEIVDPAGNSTGFGYDENNNRITERDALENVTTYKYDELNRIVGIVDPLNNNSTFELNKNGNRLSVTDGNNNITNFKYDPNGRFRFVIDAKNKTTEYKYDEIGNLRYFIDANGNTTEYKYNDKNLLTHSINPLGQTTYFEYDKNSNIKVKIDPNGNRVEYDYDELDRLLGAYYPDGTYVEYGYNDKGLKEWMEDPYGTTWYDYNDLGRLLAVTNQDDMTLEYDYNELSQKTLVRYPEGKEVKYDYDNLGRLKNVTDRFNKVTSYEYDKSGRRTKTILPNGVITSYDYNIANKLISIATINANQKILAKYQYEYDGAGNQKTFKETVGEYVYSTQYFFDELNQLEKVSNPDGSRVKYDYDNVGNRLAMTKMAGDYITTTKYEYNKANELIKFNLNDGPYTEFRYDNNGNRIAQIEPGNRVTSYAWDFENRLTKVQLHQDKWVGFEYDGAGNRITKLSAMTQPEHDNGIGNDPGVVPPGQEKAKKQQADLIYMLLKSDGGGGGSSGGGNGGGGGNSGGNGGDNGGGNSGNNGNGNGNSKDKSNNGNGPNKDKANGKADDKPKNKDIPKEDREKKKEQAKTKNGYRQKGKYTNRGKHKGWYKNGKLPGDKLEVTYYLNDVSDPLTQVLMTYGEDGKFDAAYTYGLERIEVEAVDETRPEAQDPLYYLHDSLGSVSYMVKPDGNIRDHYGYDEFGTPGPGAKLSEDGRNVLHSSFGYTGELWDEDSNLLYLRARYYEPKSGIFLSRDSYEGELENPLSKHLYLYVENNPVNFTDPTGHQRYVHYGSWGKDVRELQFRLISINFKPNGGADGYFGPSTENMVNKYKKSRGLNNKGNYWGWVGRFTWNKLLKESKMPDYKGKVVLLNASEAVLWGEGHEAILMIKPDRSAWYYSFSRGHDEKANTVNDNVEWKQYSPKEVDKGTRSLVSLINKEFRKDLDPYNREFTIYYFTNNQIQNMRNYADVRRVYNVFTYNCVNYVQGTLRSGGLWEPGGIRPNVWHESMSFNYFTN